MQLLVGDFGLSLNQQKMQMALWCIMGAPLIVSADMRKMSSESKAILLNKRAISISQDPLAVMGVRKATVQVIFIPNLHLSVHLQAGGQKLYLPTITYLRIMTYRFDYFNQRLTVYMISIVLAYWNYHIYCLVYPGNPCRYFCLMVIMEYGKAVFLFYL